MRTRIQSKSFQQVFILGTLCLFSALAGAQDQPEARPSTFEQRLIKSNIIISDWFDGVADDVDIFIAGKRYTKKKNPTNVKIENATNSSEGQSITNSSSINVNMRLPNVEEYWNLKFNDYDERKERRRAQQDPTRPPPRQKNYGATVGLFRKLGNIRTSFQPRIELKDPLKISHSLKFESEAEIKNFEVDPKIEFFANPDDGTGIFNGLNFHFTLTRVFSFTMVNEGEYLDKLNSYSVTNGFSLGQRITDRSSMSYGLSFYSNNRPSYHLEAYTVGITWSELIYKNILDYSLTPYLSFTKDRGFNSVAGLTLNINLNF